MNAFSKGFLVLMCGTLAACGAGTGGSEGGATGAAAEGAANTAAPVVVAPKVIVEEYGDSVTLGETVIDGKVAVVDQPVSTLLQSAFDSELGPGIVQVKNEGVSGSQAADLLLGSDGKHKPWAEQMAASPAKVVTLSFGLNEAYNLKKPTQGKESINPKRYREVLDELIRIARENGKEVVLYEPNPTCDDVRGDAVQYYVMQLNDLATVKTVPLIGMYWSTLQRPEWKAELSDCVHPNQALYQVRSKTAYSTLMPVVKSKL